jgi:hypothetical protein
MKTYKVPVEVKITDKEIDNIVDSAINWCSYWCDELEYGKKPQDCMYMSEALSHGGTLVFMIDEPYEEGGATKFELTTEKMLKGIAEFGEYDWENFDGPSSDAVVQQALFSEVVFS